MHLASGDIQVERSVLPPGEAAVDATVRRMVDMAHGKWGAKSAKIRALCINIVRRARVPDKDYYGEILAIHEWIKNNIRYFRDPVGQETLSYPEETAFNSQGGDCDDLTILEIAMLGAIGIKAYPVVIGVHPSTFSHVYLHAVVPPGNHRNAGATVPLDPIMKQWPAGKEAQPPRVKKKKTYQNLTSASKEDPMNGLGSYATGPSYLDQDDAQVRALLVPDNIDINKDKTVANSVRASVGKEGVDALFSTGANFTEVSAGRGGTIRRTPDGQIIPGRFLRPEPTTGEMMAMRDATKAELGPRGPIQARRAGMETRGIPGSKVYEVPTLTRKLNERQGRGASSVVVNGQRIVRGEALMPDKPLIVREADKVVDTGVRAAAINGLQGFDRDSMPRPRPTPAPVLAGEGVGGFVDTIKSPFVWVPAVALVGIVLWKVLRRKKPATASPAPTV